MTEAIGGSMTVKDAVNRFVAAAERRFTTQEALRAVEPQIARKPRNLAGVVQRHLDADERLVRHTRAAAYVPLATFLRGARFRVRPTQREIEEGLLVPGHRFLPFAARRVLPCQCELFDPDGRAVRRRVVEWTAKDLLIFFTLLGPAHMVEYLLADQDSNAKRLQDEGPRSGEALALTVYDLGEAYARWKFQPGDDLILTVQDWAAGRFDVEFATGASSRPTLDACRAWCSALEEGLLACLDRLGVQASVHDQLAWALVHGPELLIRQPALHVGGFLAQSERLQIAEVGMQTLLWRKGETPADSLFDHATGPEPTGECDSLDGICTDLGLAIEEGEIEACMRDELYRGGQDKEAVLARCFGNRPGGLVFADQTQAAAFVELFDRRWDEVRAAYDRGADREKGPLRAKLLGLLDRHVAWMRDCDRRGVAVEDLPAQLVADLGPMMGLVSQILIALNGSDGLDAPTRQMVEEILGPANAALDALAKGMPGAADSESRPALRLLDSEEPVPAGSIYQLKVILEGVRPAVWRRLQVPAAATLPELHDMIQAAMGWSGSEGHEFLIDDVYYTRLEDFPEANDEEGDDQNADETGVQLGQVLGKEPGDFGYLYDFAREWGFTVRMEKLFAAEADSVYPRCTGGRRAAPPEECGGAADYQELCAALLLPLTREGREAREALGEGFQPELFETEAINRELEKRRPQ